MQETIQTTHELMDTYVRLMSQTEHTQRLLLDGEWEMQKVRTEFRSVALAARYCLMHDPRSRLLVHVHRTRPKCEKQKKRYFVRDKRKKHGYFAKLKSGRNESEGGSRRRTRKVS